MRQSMDFYETVNSKPIDGAWTSSSNTIAVFASTYVHMMLVGQFHTKE
jgi:hypothetical protein